MGVLRMISGHLPPLLASPRWGEEPSAIPCPHSHRVRGVGSGVPNPYSGTLGARASGVHGVGTIPSRASHARARGMECGSHAAAPTALIAPPLRNRLDCRSLAAGSALQLPIAQRAGHGASFITHTRRSCAPLRPAALSAQPRYRSRGTGFPSTGRHSRHHSPPSGQLRKGLPRIEAGLYPPTRRPSPPVPLLHAGYAVSELWVIHSR